jgi:NADH dehydrogenase
MAGAISELARFTLKKDFRHVNPADARVILVEAAPRILQMFDPDLSEKALEHLKKLQVDVRQNTRVTHVTDDYVELEGVPIPTRTVIWAAGNMASPLGEQLGVEIDRQGRVIVNPDLSIPAHPEVFVVGDMAFAKRANGAAVPGVSPAALQGGHQAGTNILHLLKGEPTQPFQYLDKGSMATIGRHAAVADLHVIKFGGFFAWLTWAFVHLYFLIGFKNRIMVFLSWALSYFTYSKGSRLIQVPPPQGTLLRHPPRP